MYDNIRVTLNVYRYDLNYTFTYEQCAKSKEHLSVSLIYSSICFINFLNKKIVCLVIPYLCIARRIQHSECLNFIRTLCKTTGCLKDSLYSSISLNLSKL